MFIKVRHTRLLKLIAIRMVCLLLVNTTFQQASYALPTQHTLAPNSIMDNLGDKAEEYQRAMEFLFDDYYQRSISDDKPRLDGEIEAVHNLYLEGYLDYMPDKYIGYMTREAAKSEVAKGSRLAERYKDEFNEKTQGILAMMKAPAVITPENAVVVFRAVDSFPWVRIPAGAEGQVMVEIMRELALALDKDPPDLCAPDLWKEAIAVAADGGEKQKSLVNMVNFIINRFSGEGVERLNIFEAIDRMGNLTGISLWKRTDWDVIAEIFNIPESQIPKGKRDLETVIGAIIYKTYQAVELGRFRYKDAAGILTGEEELALCEQLQAGNAAAYEVFHYLFWNYIIEWAGWVESESRYDVELKKKGYIVPADIVEREGLRSLERRILRFDPTRGTRFSTYLMAKLMTLRPIIENAVRRGRLHEEAASYARGVSVMPEGAGEEVVPERKLKLEEALGKAQNAVRAIFAKRRADEYNRAYNACRLKGRVRKDAATSANKAAELSGASYPDEHILLQHFFGGESPAERKPYAQIGQEGIPIVKQTGKDGALEPDSGARKTLKAAAIGLRARRAKDVLGSYMSDFRIIPDVDVASLSQEDLIKALVYMWDHDLVPSPDEIAAGEEETGPIGSTGSGIFPHRGYRAGETINNCMVTTLERCIPAWIKEGILTEAEAQPFRDWLALRVLGADVPPESRLPIDNLVEKDAEGKDIEIKAYDGRTLRIVKLPVDRLGEIDGEPFFGHIGLTEGIIWVAADRDPAEVAVTIMHEEQEYNNTAAAAQRLGLTMEQMALLRDIPMLAPRLIPVEAKGYVTKPFEVQLLFEIIHVNAWLIAASQCEKMLPKAAATGTIDAALRRLTLAKKYKDEAMKSPRLHGLKPTGRISDDLAAFGMGQVASDEPAKPAAGSAVSAVLDRGKRSQKKRDADRKILLSLLGARGRKPDRRLQRMVAAGASTAEILDYIAGRAKLSCRGRVEVVWHDLKEVPNLREHPNNPFRAIDIRPPAVRDADRRDLKAVLRRPKDGGETYTVREVSELTAIAERHIRRDINHPSIDETERRNVEIGKERKRLAAEEEVHKQQIIGVLEHPEQVYGKEPRFTPHDIAEVLTSRGYPISATMARKYVVEIGLRGHWNYRHVAGALKRKKLDVERHQRQLQARLKTLEADKSNPRIPIAQLAAELRISVDYVVEDLYALCPNRHPNVLYKSHPQPIRKDAAQRIEQLLEKLAADPAEPRVTSGDISRMLIEQGYPITGEEVNDKIYALGLRKKYPHVLAYERVRQQRGDLSRSDILAASLDELPGVLSGIKGAEELTEPECLVLRLDAHLRHPKWGSEYTAEYQKVRQQLTAYRSKIRELRASAWTKLAPLLQKAELKELGAVAEGLTPREREVVRWCFLDSPIEWVDPIKAGKLSAISPQDEEASQVNPEDVQGILDSAREKLEQSMSDNLYAAFFGLQMDFPPTRAKSRAKDTNITNHDKITEAVCVDGKETMGEIAECAEISDKEVEILLAGSLRDLRPYLRLRQLEPRSTAEIEKQREKIKAFVTRRVARGKGRKFVTHPEIAQKLHGDYTQKQLRTIIDDVKFLISRGELQPNNVKTREQIAQERLEDTRVFVLSQKDNWPLTVPYITQHFHGRKGRKYTETQRKSVYEDLMALLDRGGRRGLPSKSIEIGPTGVKRKARTKPKTGGGVTQAGVLPHRGPGTVNDWIVLKLGECLPTLISDERLTDEDAEAFREWFATREPGADVPYGKRLPIYKLTDREKRMASDGTRLRVVRLPVEELGRIKVPGWPEGKPFYAHANFTEGIIWVAAGRDEAKVEADIIHEVEEYNIAAEEAKKRGWSMARMALWRDGKYTDPNPEYNGFEKAKEFFSKAHLDAWQKVADTYFAEIYSEPADMALSIKKFGYAQQSFRDAQLAWRRPAKVTPETGLATASSDQPAEPAAEAKEQLLNNDEETYEAVWARIQRNPFAITAKVTDPRWHPVDSEIERAFADEFAGMSLAGLERVCERFKGSFGLTVEWDDNLKVRPEAKYPYIQYFIDILSASPNKMIHKFTGCLDRINIVKERLAIAQRKQLGADAEARIMHDLRSNYRIKAFIRELMKRWSLSVWRRMDSINTEHMDKKAGLVRRSLAKGREIIIPRELIPEKFWEALERMRAEEGFADDIKVVSWEDAKRMATNKKEGENRTIILNPQMEKEMGENCRATKVVLTKDKKRNFLYLHGGIAIARSINAGDDELIKLFYNRVTGQIADKQVMEELGKDKRLKLPLPEIEKPALEMYDELEKEAFKFLKSA